MLNIGSNSTQVFFLNPTIFVLGSASAYLKSIQRLQYELFILNLLFANVEMTIFPILFYQNKTSITLIKPGGKNSFLYIDVYEQIS